MSRSLALALLLALGLFSPVLTSQGDSTPTPPPVPGTATDGTPVTTPIAIPSRNPRTIPPSTPEPGPTDQPGLFSSDASLLARDPTGPFLRGDDDVLAVVGVFPDDSGNDVLVALRNNTGNTIRGAEVTATLSDPETGAPIALGITSDIAPATIVPGGLSFALVTLEGADGRLGPDTLPHVEAREAERNSLAAEVDLRLASATVTESDVLAAVAIDSGSASALQMIVVCVRQAGSHYVLVDGWSSSVTLYEVQLEAGDTTTLQSSPPIDCGGRFIVTVASF